MMKQKRKVTMADVAREAGCSRSAVSYAILRNHPLSEELKARIFAAIERLEYHPYGSRSRPEKRAVALLADTAPDNSNRIAHMFRGELQKHGLITQQYSLPRYTPFNPKDSELFTLLNNDPNLAGIICIHPDINSFDLLKRCKNVPAVIYYRENSMLSHILVLHRQIGELAAKHLVRLGHPKAAFVMFDEPELPYNARILDGLRGEPHFAASGIELEQLPLRMDSLAPEELTPKLDALIARGVGVIFAQGPMQARPILQWAYRRELRIPRDLSLFCVDFSEGAGLLSPPLTAVTLPTAALVELTVAELLAKLAHRDPPEKVLPPYLVDRGSTAPWKIG